MGSSKEYNRLYNLLNKKKVQRLHKRWKKSHPWQSFYSGAKTRCTNLKAHNFKWYGGKGIKFLMTMENFKYLWFRDKAYKMKRPSIDRKNSNGNYELSNCRFIEHRLNSKRVDKKHLIGSNNSLSKLDDSKVKFIRKCYKNSKISQATLAKKFGVCRLTINKIINYKAWNHI